MGWWLVIVVPLGFVILLFGLPAFFLWLIWFISPRRRKKNQNKQGWWTRTVQHAQNNRGWLLSFILMIGVGSFVWYFLPGFLRSSVLFWAVILFVGATFVPKLTGAEWHTNALRAVAILLAVVVVASSGIGKWTARNYEHIVERGLGEGNWSAPADYLPTYSGGTMRLKSSEQKTVILAGKVRVPNPLCHIIDVDPPVTMFEDLGAENIFIEPLPGLDKQQTTVSAVKWYGSYACRKYWEERLPRKSKLRQVHGS